jgi:peptide-methionine (S)-S-oxide reductase
MYNSSTQQNLQHIELRRFKQRFFTDQTSLESMSERVNGVSTSEVITLGGGCFWCTEAVFSEIRGVKSVKPGYSGGHVANPTYEEVCTDTTGHAEVVQIEFDLHLISLEQLLTIFFTIHDPTTLNRQGADVGTQYRSVIFYHNEEQRKVALNVMREIAKSGIWNREIVTKLEPFSVFYPAEEYHVNYFKRNPTQPYCQMVIAPKIAKFRKHYLEMLKSG